MWDLLSFLAVVAGLVAVGVFTEETSVFGIWWPIAVITFLVVLGGVLMRLEVPKHIP